VFNYYSECLEQSFKGKAFLKSRKLNGQSIIQNFRLGYSGRTLGLNIKKLSRQDELASRGSLQRAGLLKASGHEFFRGALVFPFVNSEGHVVGAYGRRITPKLSSGSVYFIHWLTPETRFFNEAEIGRNQEAFLCKNPLDAVSLSALGLENVLGLMGVYSFSSRHLSYLQSSGIRRLIIAFGDSREECVFARRIAKLVKRANIDSFILLLPDGMDINSCLMKMERPEHIVMQALSSPFEVSTHATMKH
jgi:DNA primase